MKLQNHISYIEKMIKKGKYKHFKGNFYQVVDVARNSETLEDFVVYRALYGDNGLWIRPLEMFLEEVDIDGKSIERFQFIEDDQDS